MFLYLQSSVLIIGAGTAGLVVANHLKNFGHQVQINIRLISLTSWGDACTHMVLLINCWFSPLLELASLRNPVMTLN